MDSNEFHKLYGVKKPRMAYQRNDLIDYLLMSLISAFVVLLSYGLDHVIAKIGVALCAMMAATFVIRHGAALRIPLILRRPQDVLYMLVSKLRNMKPMYLLAVGLLLLQSVLVHLTPGLAHHTELMRKIALYLFYAHFIGLSAYRTAILIVHLYKRKLVHEVLTQTTWRSRVCGRSPIVLEIVHAYVTGMLTHIILIAPWYLAITHLEFSVIFFPVFAALNVVMHLKYMKTYNAWFYRDHWLGHNAELEFVYLHGTHHDAIPSGLIGVSGNGCLEGFLRHTLGNPTPYYHPIIAFLLYTLEVQQDIKNHQYIPGVYPKIARRFHESFQHSTHHFGRLEPYSIALKSSAPAAAPSGKAGFELIPEELSNSIALDEKLNGFVWDNSTHRKFLELVDRYQ